MIRIKDFKKLDLAVTWTLLYISAIAKQISLEEIADYACDKIEEGIDEINIYELAGMNENLYQEMLKILRILSSNENIDINIERRKLRAVILSRVLKRDDDYLNGIISIRDTWNELSYMVNVKDVPFFIQGYSNLLPTEYYTKENYNRIYEQNVEWLNKEVESLRTY